MVRAGRAMHEIPLSQRTLVALHDEQRLAGEDEEVLLSASQWYIAIGSPGPSTLMLIPTCEKSESPSNSQTAGRPAACARTRRAR